MASGLLDDVALMHMYTVMTPPPPGARRHDILFCFFNFTQAQLEIMANPMSDNVQYPSAAAGPAEACGGTPVHPRFATIPSHLTPVGNWNATNDRSRLSGAGGSPTECFRDYLSGLQGKEEEEEEEVRCTRYDSVPRSKLCCLVLCVFAKKKMFNLRCSVVVDSHSRRCIPITGLCLCCSQLSVLYKRGP